MDMKKYIFILLLLFVSLMVSAQTHRYYCEIKGAERALSSKMKVVFDFGQNSAYSIWSTLSSKVELVDENGEEIEFNSMVDAMNYMEERGWHFQQAYASYRGGDAIEHWILYKDAESKEKARERLMTKEEYKKLHD